MELCNKAGYSTEGVSEDDFHDLMNIVTVTVDEHMNPKYFALLRVGASDRIRRTIISTDGKLRGVVFFRNYLQDYRQAGVGVAIVGNGHLVGDGFIYSMELGADDLFGVDAGEMIRKTFFPEDSGTESGDNYAP